LPINASLGLFSSSRLRFVLAVLVVMASGLGIAVLGSDVARQIDTQSSTSIDNVQWALSQVDVELLHLQLSLSDAMDNPEDLTGLRLRYDVFLSRIQTLQLGSVFATLRRNPDFAASFDKARAFVQDTAPLVDGDDAALRKVLPELNTRVRALIPEAHRIALTGVSLFAVQSDADRAAVKLTLIQVVILTLVLIAALVALLAMVLRLDRGNRRKAQQNAETLARLDAVVATSLDAVITLDDQGRIVDFNPAACATFGYDEAEAVGRDLGLLVPLNRHGTAQLPTLGAGQPETDRRRRVTARHRDGHDFPAEISLTLAQAGARSVQVVFLRDLSQQVAAEQALVTARDEALAGEKAKADLLVVMSHEIRTPLNGMIGTIDLLESTALAPHQREYLRIMAASGRLLMHHVNDVLDIARLDSGKAPLSMAPVDLTVLVREVIENQGPASLANGNRLAAVIPDEPLRPVLGDAAQLRQVLLNLVGNAVKFTRDGEIGVEIVQDPSRGATEIVVRDTGIGIEREDLGRIFEDFVTLDPSYARHAAGTGLGLGIVRRIVTRMGGKITVNSRKGQGATFRVNLPLAILDTAAPAPAETLHEAAQGLSILVVEDNDFNRLIVRDMLVQEGHRVTEAHDGTLGVQLAFAQRFDVILMDISMPGIDGLQAAEQIRAGRGASAASPIVALTAHALREERERFQSGGMQDVLIKPITRDALHRLLGRLALIAQSPGEDTAEADAAQAEAAPAELLDAVILSQLRATLGPAKAARLIQRFLDETEARVAQVLALSDDPDRENLVISEIHQMSGAAALFGASALHDHLLRIEELCKRGQKAEARSLAPEIVPLWRQTAEALRKTLQDMMA
jgi:PAS domain S-box-containing protein